MFLCQFGSFCLKKKHIPHIYVWRPERRNIGTLFFTYVFSKTKIFDNYRHNQWSFNPYCQVTDFKKIKVNCNFLHTLSSLLVKLIEIHETCLKIISKTSFMSWQKSNQELRRQKKKECTLSNRGCIKNHILPDFFNFSSSQNTKLNYLINFTCILAWCAGTDKFENY